MDNVGPGIFNENIAKHSLLLFVVNIHEDRINARVGIARRTYS